MNQYIHFNGDLVPAGKEIITADSRGLRYGDGVFETIKVINGNVQLAPLHYERLFHSLSVLQIQLPVTCTADYLTESIIALCRKNNTLQQSRVRLTVFRGNGTLYKTESTLPDLVIQSEPLPPEYLQFNEKGLVIDVYDEARKSCDMLANLKSNNFLPYIMGALYSKRNSLNDCLLLNTNNRICDATIANIFWVRNDAVYTPPLSEGCVAGVMRRYILEGDATIKEKELTIEELEQADEVFLTNALYGTRWVGQFRGKQYKNSVSAAVYKRHFKISDLTEHS
jgi:branched-chain amino acid aminotransferase